MCVTLLITSNLWRSNECSQAASYVHLLFLFLLLSCKNRYSFQTHSLPDRGICHDILDTLSVS